jgi:hypothetical protein
MKYLIIIIGLLIISCKGDVRINLDALKKKRYTFSELPNQVKEIIENEIDEMDKAEYDYFTSIDSNLDLKYERSGGGKNWIEDINNNYHYFIINGKEMKLRGNQGDPFILHDSILYYTTELNFFKERYKETSYIGIDLKRQLK